MAKNIAQLLAWLMLAGAVTLSMSCAPAPAPAPSATQAAAAPPTTSPSLSVDITSPINPNLMINEPELETARIDGLPASAAAGTRWYDYGGNGQVGYPRYLVHWNTTGGTLTDPYSFTTTFIAPDYQGTDLHTFQIDADAVEPASPAGPGNPADLPSPRPLRGDHQWPADFLPDWATNALFASDAAKTRAEAIDGLRKVILAHSADPLTIVLQFRIAVLLTERPESPGDPAAEDRGLAVLEQIIRQYDHADYYRADYFVGYCDNPMTMVPRAAILAGNILWARHGDAVAAQAYLMLAMRDLAWSWQKRRHDWLTAPRPKPIAENDFEQDVPQRNAFAIKQWQQHKLDAAAGKITPDPYGQELMEAAVRQFGMSFGPQRPQEVAGHMREIIAAFPDTPLAAIAQAHIDRARVQ